MSEDMPHSWRYITSAGSRISSLKGYITNHESSSRWRPGRSAPSTTNTSTLREERQSWRAWAGQKIRVRKRGASGANDSNELVNVFPGWAVRRYAAESAGAGDGPRPFELEVFVSGYAISYRSPENASRSQRAFIRLAKGFASLPKIVDSAADVPQNSTSLARLTPSTEALLAQVKLPPRPVDITDDYDIDALERQLRRAKKDRNDDDEVASSPSPLSSTDDLPATQVEASGPTQFVADHTPDMIKRLHANLEQRLQPFWSSVLPNRTIRLYLFATPHQDSTQPGSIPGNSEDKDKDTELLLDPQCAPLASQDVSTSADGSFQIKLKINWEELCHHPRALHIAFGEAMVEHELMIIAQLLPQVRSSSPSPSPSPYPQIDNPTTTPVPLTSLTRIPITYSPIRVISDIDDTIKFSGILSGARAVFKNVFVNELRESVIPGMGEWYAAMWSRGVRFHYVSNGPFELLPILNEFFEISQLPLGSIKLRSYAGRSLFNGLLSAPAARKRAGVVDVLDSFPESRFFLIGDSGEQDLELYADLARERPDRILAVFIRDADANTFEGPAPLEDPTGWKQMAAAGTRSADRPLASRSESGMTTASNVSASSSSSAYNYNKFNFFTSANSVPAIPTGEVEDTPRPNSFSFASGNGNGKQHASASSLDDKALLRAKDQQQQQHLYFGSSKLSAEPESLENASASTSGPAILVNGPSTPSPNRFVDKPPRPTPPPSIRNNSLSLGPSSASTSTPASAGLSSSSSTSAAAGATSLRTQRSGSSTSSTSSLSLSLGRKAGALVESERKRNELQARVYRARTQMPSHIPLRVFRDPVECVEAQEILEREGS